jgi:hypothetical protein
MNYRSYLTLAEFSDIWQNGCIPLGWLALFRDGEPLDAAPDADDTGGGFWGYRTSAWEAIDSLDRAIAILQRDPYLWSYFNVLALLLEEVQQLPTEEEITLDCSEFAAAGPDREAAARAAVDGWRDAVRLVQAGPEEADAARAAFRVLAEGLSLDQGLPFTGDLAADVAELGGRTAALEELIWTITGEMYEGPEERLDLFTPEAMEAAYWPWLIEMPDDTPAPSPDATSRNGHGPE